MVQWLQDCTAVRFCALRSMLHQNQMGLLGAAGGASCGVCILRLQHCISSFCHLHAAQPCSHIDAGFRIAETSFMAGMVTPAPGQFDAQAPGVTAATGTAPEGLDNDLHSLEQQLAELQVCVSNGLKYCSGMSSYTRAAGGFATSATMLAGKGTAEACRSRFGCSLQQVFQ